MSRSFTHTPFRQVLRRRWSTRRSRSRTALQWSRSSLHCQMQPLHPPQPSRAPGTLVKRILPERPKGRVRHARTPGSRCTACRRGLRSRPAQERGRNRAQTTCIVVGVLANDVDPSRRVSWQKASVVTGSGGALKCAAGNAGGRKRRPAGDHTVPRPPGSTTGRHAPARCPAAVPAAARRPRRAAGSASTQKGRPAVTGFSHPLYLSFRTCAGVVCWGAGRCGRPRAPLSPLSIPHARLSRSAGGERAAGKADRSRGRAAARARMPAPAAH